jgi:hypothetical protein
MCFHPEKYIIWCGSHTGEAYSKTGRIRVV